MKRHSRSGFSLVELLVLIALLMFAIGMLVPIIQQIRLAAARTESQNNLKQIGLAVHNYASTFNNKLPPGPDNNGFSTAAHLLPFLEQQNVFMQIDFKKPATDEANEKVRNTVIPVFLSPLDPLSHNAKGGVAHTSYLFCAGSKHSLDDNNGLFWKKCLYNIGNIPDGSSNTVMVGETLIGDGSKQAKTVKRQHVALTAMALKNLNDNSGVKEFADDVNIAGDRGHSWLEGKFLYTVFTGTRKLNDSRPDVSCGGLGGLSALRSQQNQTNILLADGHVRIITEKLSLETWQNACSADDGNPLGNDW
jgi:prepilin-type processing-associated H-X9-DG protein